MKIRFDSPRTSPEDDNGTKVQYAPAKRQAFKLRWYLLLLLAASPFLYAAWIALANWWTIEAPGYIVLPVHSITAPQNAVVENLNLTDNAVIRAGQPLLQLRRPELDSQIKALQTILQHSQASPPPSAARSDNRVARSYAEQLVASYRKLFAQGAATRAELNEAEARLAASQPPAPVRLPPDNTAYNQNIQQQAQLQALLEQQSALQLKAPVSGRVQGIFTHSGLPVQQGQKLLTLQEDQPLKIVALLPAHYNRYASASQQATVILPDGRKLAAQVLFNGIETEQVPEVLRALGSDKQGIVLQLKTLQDVPAELRLNNLPVRVVFKRGGLS